MPHIMDDPPFPEAVCWRVMRWSDVDHGWVPASNKLGEDSAVEALAELRNRMPDTTFRIIRTTTTYATTEH